MVLFKLKPHNSTEISSTNTVNFIDDAQTSGLYMCWFGCNDM